jgi:AcrR family transcriptional regulator
VSQPRRAQRVRRIDRRSRSSGADQRWRLIQATIEFAAKFGYQDMSIERLRAGAGVSPSTFYEFFGDKEELSLAAYRSCAEAMFGPMRLALLEDQVARIPRLALDALLKAAAADPDAARIVFVQALGGAARMAAARREVFERFERRVQQYLQRVPADAMTLDIPVSAIAGALRHIVSRHLRTHAEDQLPGLLDDGLAWLYAYVRPAGAEPWSTSPRALLDGLAPSRSPQPWSPKTLPPARTGYRRARSRAAGARASFTRPHR